MHFDRSMVVRRVTLDVDKQVVLQDLTDVAIASDDVWHFAVSRSCKRLETGFYYLKRGCSWHRRVPLTDGRAKKAEVYPEGLVRAIIPFLSVVWQSDRSIRRKTLVFRC